MGQVSFLTHHLGLKHGLLAPLLTPRERSLGQVFGLHQNLSRSLVLGRSISSELEAVLFLLLVGLGLHLKIITQILHPLPCGCPVLQVDVGLDFHRRFCLAGDVALFGLLCQ